MKDVLFTPVLSWPLLVIVTLAVAVVFGWSFFYGLQSKARIALLWGLRCLALLVFFVVLLQPQRRYDEVTVLRPQLAVLVDTSESMTDPVDDGQPRRAERVREFLDSPALKKAAENFDVRLFSFDQAVQERTTDKADWKFAGNRSEVGSAVSQIQERFRGQPLAAVLLLTDGLDTTGAAKSAPAAGVPVFTFELEKPFTPKARPKSVAISNVDYPQRVVVGWDTEIRASIAGSGMNGRATVVELWRSGKKVNEASVTFNQDEQTRETPFAVSHDKPGMVQYEARLTDPAATEQGKTFTFLVEVVEPGNRILYLQNTLGFDFKFLRKAITSDRNLQLSALVRWADGRIVNVGDSGSRVPQSALEFSQQSLASYAVVMLGDLPPDTLKPAQLKAVRDYVDRGGGLILLGGPNGVGSPEFSKTPLGALLPLKIGAAAEYREGHFPVEITTTGLRHPVFGPLFAKVKDFPALLTLNMSESVAPTAEVLLEANAGGRTQPVVAAMRFGQGRVVVMMTDTIWRWRLAAKSWTSEKSPYDTLWAQMMDWLIPKEKQKQNIDRIELFTERSNYMLGERPEVRAIISMQSSTAKPPATLPLQVRAPDEKVLEYTMRPATLQTTDGRQVPGYRVEVEPHVPGVFVAKSSAELGAKIEGETRFVVTKPVTEITGKPIERDLLRRIAESSRGKFYALDEWNNWPAGIHYEEQHFSRVQLQDLWNHPAMLAFLLGMLAADWVARKLWNLP